MGGRIKKAAFGLAGLLGVAVCAELVARYGLGLGTPPLSITHPTIEYLFKPNQDVYRFGNHIVINQYGMRSSYLADKKKGEFRVLMFGDSVINGGSQTDQADIATSIMQKRIALNSKGVFVGNIAAGSWGPGNWLAYAKEFGFFDADVVVLVVSSHDVADNPKFEPLDETTHPTKAPRLAIEEALTRYLPRYLPAWLGSHKPAPEPDKFSEFPYEDEVAIGLRDLQDFLLLAKEKVSSVFVLQHWEEKEVKGNVAKVGNLKIAVLCEKLKIKSIQLGPAFKQSLDAGQNPYRDNVHPNQIGQRLIAEEALKQIHAIGDADKHLPSLEQP